MIPQIRGLLDTDPCGLEQLHHPRPLQPAGDPRPEGPGRRGIYVSGSATLVRALLADGLVDELHLFVFPLALGSGQRLFADGIQTTKLALAGCETYTSGALHLTYTPAAST